MLVVAAEFLALAALAQAAAAPASSRTINIVNECPYPVYPALSGNDNDKASGFELAAGATQSVSAPTQWSGRVWARTQCNDDGTDGFKCATGDCGTGKVTWCVAPSGRLVSS